MLTFFSRLVMNRNDLNDLKEAYKLSESDRKLLFTAPMLGMGEVVFFSMTARIIKENRPHSGIYFLTKGYSCEFLQTISQVDECTPLERFHLTRLLAGSPIARNFNWLKMILFLKREKFDVVAIQSKSRAFTFLMYVTAKLSGTQKVILLLPLLTKYLQPSKHVVESYKVLLRDLGLEFDEREKPSLEASARGRQFALELLAENGICREKNKVVGFCPMTLAEIKEWSADNFAELGNKLLQDDAVRIILFGYNNPERAQRIAEKMGRKPLIVYRLSLENLIGLISECDLFVSVDTGPMHIAAALNVPTVGIFGPTSGTMYGPYSENSVAVQKDIECPRYVPNFVAQKKQQLCYVDGRCIVGPVSCVDKISIEEVLLAIQQVYPCLRYDHKLSSN